MSENQDNLARVSIFGHEYTVKAQAEASYIADVAQFVDQKMYYLLSHQQIIEFLYLKEIVFLFFF